MHSGRQHSGQADALKYCVWAHILITARIASFLRVNAQMHNLDLAKTDASVPSVTGNLEKITKRFKMTIKKIINAGIHQYTTFNSSKRIRALNIIGLTGGLFGFAVFVFCYINELYLAVFAQLLTTVTLLSLPYFNYKGLYNFSVSFFIVAIQIDLLALSYSFGLNSNFGAYFIMILSFIFTFIDKKTHIIAHTFIVSMVVFINFYFVPKNGFMTDQVSYVFSIVNVFASMFYTTLLLRIIFNENENYQKTILTQNLTLQKSNELISRQNTELIDSLNYAEKIQRSLLADINILREKLSEHFVIYKPKHIVSGDFYWTSQKNGCLYLALGDCTGHGVPGAFMSLMCIAYLNEAVDQLNLQRPNEIFEYLKNKIIASVGKGSKNEGMEGIIVKIPLESFNDTIEYSSANTTPFLHSGDKVVSLNYDRTSLSLAHQSDKLENYSYKIRNGETLFFSTDGYKDQFGGARGKKFLRRNLITLIEKLSNENSSLDKIASGLDFEFERWKGDLEQVDDVSIVGIRLSNL